MTLSPRPLLVLVRRFVRDGLDGALHRRALLAYLLVVGGHFAEHLAQAAQVFVLGWARADAGGLLGLAVTGATESELLHVAYNSLQLSGLIALAWGFREQRAAHALWIVALVAQAWHWLEHAFLIVQVLTGTYFYGALKQMSVLERFVPRLELHLIYNLAVVVPTLAAALLYLRAQRRKRDA